MKFLNTVYDPKGIKMRVLLGVAILFDQDENLNMSQFLAGVAFEEKQLKERFPDHTEIFGLWDCANRARYTLYCIREVS